MNKAILNVSKHWFAEMLKAGTPGARQYEVTEHALPDDCRVAEVFTDPGSAFSTITIIVESAAFPEGCPALEPPVFRVTYEEPA